MRRQENDRIDLSDGKRIDWILGGQTGARAVISTVLKIVRAFCPLQDGAGRDRDYTRSQPRKPRRPEREAPEAQQGPDSRMGTPRGMAIRRGTAGLYGVRQSGARPGVEACVGPSDGP